PQMGYGTPVGIFPQFSGEFGNGDEYADPYDDDDVDEGDRSFTGYGRRPKIVGHGFPEIWPVSYARSWVNAGEVRCALLQHYGIPTPTLDASTHPLVSLWFATHEMLRDNEDRAYYQQIRTPGIVYSLTPNRERVIDLSSSFISAPIFGLRGKQQDGVLFEGATEQKPDISELISGKVFVDPRILQDADDRLKHLSQEYLFPGPDKDKLYARLIEEKKAKASGKLLEYVIEYVAI
ncbi:MAG: FRG domain-containing protein, partial [Nitrospira sp.]